MIDGNAHTRQVILVEKIRQATHLPAIKSPGGKLDPDCAEARLALGHQIVFGPAVVVHVRRGIYRDRSRQRRGSDIHKSRPLNRRRHGEDLGRRLRSFAFFKDQASKLFDALFAQNEFHARFKLILAVTGFAEDTQNGFDGGEQLFFRQKLCQDRGFCRQAAQAAAYENFEAAARGPVRTAHLRDQPHVMDAGNSATTIIGAAGKSNFEFARQVVKIRMAQKVARNT